VSKVSRLVQRHYKSADHIVSSRAALEGLSGPIGWLIIAFLFFQQVYAVWITLHAAPTQWVDFFEDDAYYYLAIARHISAYGVSSFSLPTETNGYQPLWLGILSLTAKLVNADRTLLVAVTHLLACIAMVSFLLLSGKQYRTIWPAAFAMLLFPNIMTAGMETVLIPPLALLYLHSTSWHRRGLFSSLLFLARLDTLALVAGCAAYDLVSRRRINPAEYVPLLFTTLAYFSFNWLVFGTPLPVSGLAKAVGNWPGENLPTGMRIVRRSLPAIISLVPLFLLHWKGIYLFRDLKSIVVSVFAVVVTTLYYSIMSGWPLWSWYLWPLMMLIYFTLIEVAAIEVRSAPRWNLAAATWKVVAIVLISTHGFAAYWVYHGRLRPLSNHIDGEIERSISFGYDNVLVAQRLNARSKWLTVAMSDRAGSLGYFLTDHLRLIQIEGLVGSYEQIRQMREDRTEEYISAERPEWLIVDRDQPLEQVGGQYLVEEPFQGLSVHTGSYVLCFPVGSRVESAEFGSLRDQRYFFRYADKASCSPAALRWFKDWRDRYHGPIHGNLQRLPLFMEYPGDL
jgi:hypothetical protein